MTIHIKDLYGDSWQEQAARYETIRQGFIETFGDDQGTAFYSAPGRTEIGGNHTDHNHGRVLAGSIDLDIVGLARRTNDGVAKLRSVEYPRMDTIELTQLEPRKENSGSQAIIRGILARCRELGYQVGGFQCPVEAAKIAQYAENVYFGKPSGLLDQMAASMGSVTAMDFADPSKPIVENVDFDLNAYGHALCVVDTGGNHADLTPDYAAVPQEMKAVAKYFGKEFLRDVDEREFYSSLVELRKATNDRAVLRAMHFYDDDRLAHEEAEALKRGDFEGFLKMVNASGRSSQTLLQNVYSPAHPEEQGISLALTLSEFYLQGRGACRVHGGGFAGTIQAYVPFDLLDSYRDGMESVFGKGSCYVLTVRSCGGVKVEL